MKLNNENIDKAVAEIQKFFEQAKISRRDMLKLNLVSEESLLRCQDHFGEDKDFEIKTRQWFGAPKVVIKIKGAVYNPLDSEDDASLSADIMQNLLNYETASTTYIYKNGANEITLSAAKEKKPIKIPGGSITISIVLALISSFAVEFLPLHVQNAIIEILVTPVLNSLMSLIVAVTIPTIFISVVSSICVMDDVVTLNNIGLRVIKRFIAIMLLVIIVSMIASEMFFSVVAPEGDSNLLIEQIITLMLSIIPTNVFQAFLDGNVLQIVMMAFATGACVVVLDKRTANFKSFVNEFKNILFKIMEWILKVIPLTIFLSVFKTVVTTPLSSILMIWKFVAVCYVTYISVGLIMLLYLKAKYKISLKDFFKKNAPVFIVTTTTASGSLSMMANFDVLKKNLKLDPNLCDFWIPLSHTLFSPGTVNMMVVCAFMGAVMSGGTISISQLLVIAFLAIQLSIVTPKVYGGNVAGFTMLLHQLGFSLDVIGTMMIVDVFSVNLSALFGMVARNCEIFDLSHQVKF